MRKGESALWERTIVTGNRDALPKVCLYVLVGLAALSAAAYARSLSLPFISDDYLQIALARQFGPVSGWRAVAADALYRCRETSLILTWWTERIFGVNDLVFNWSSLLLHVANTWLVFALGAWRLIGWRVSAVAAAFFAVYEGHQEAVIWFAAIPELLVFFFVLLGLVAWIAWVQSGCRGVWRPAAALACYILALFSKESAVAMVGLMAVVALMEQAGRRAWIWLAPFAVLAAVYFQGAAGASASHLHFNDGTFSLSAPFWRTIAISTGRLFWFWGLLAVVSLLAWRAVRFWKLAALAAAWIVLTFLPYSFLTYMPRVPSRHTYFASAGLALVVGAWLWMLWERRGPGRRWVVGALAAIIVLHNCGYIWTRKHRQFQERARATEELIEYGRKVDGPVPVRCFPYPLVLAELALDIELGKRMSLSSAPGTGFCMDDPAPPVASAGHLLPN
jgi:hypothetical protein